MKYFIFESDESFLDRPILGNWKETIDINWINKEGFYKIPKRLVWPMTSTNDTIFPSLITPPFLLISDMVMSVIQKYGDNVIYRDVILLNSKIKVVQRYFLVVLDEIKIASFDACSSKTRLKKISLIRDGRPLEDRNIFSVTIEGTKKVIINLDFAESILRRKAMGVYLEEVELKEIRPASSCQ